MGKLSAGILAYRDQNALQVLLVHPGGPFFIKKDLGIWSLPKGEYTTEIPLQVAIREFTEETGSIITGKNFMELNPVKLKSGKMIRAWAVKADFVEPYISSNTFELEWPPKSGKICIFPEVDKAEWFSIAEGMEKIHPGQIPFLEELQKLKLNNASFN